MKKYARLAGIEGVTPRTFRYSVATRLARDPQVDMVTAATFLGYSRLDATARHSRPDEDDPAQATERVQGTFLAVRVCQVLHDPAARRGRG